MRQLYILILLFSAFSFLSHSQTNYSNALDAKVFALKQYVFKEFKQLKQFYPIIDALEIGVEIDTDTKMIEEVTLSGYADSNRIDTLVFWAPLEKEIKRLFYFNPSIDDDAVALFNYTMFRITLDQTALKEELKVEKELLANKCNYLIKPNAKFRLTINELTCKPFMKEDRIDSLPKMKIKSQLNALKSDVFQVGENYFIFFQSKIATTDDSCPCELTAHIYFVTEGMSDLLTSITLENSISPIFQLKEHSSWENKGALTPEVGFFRVDMEAKFK